MFENSFYSSPFFTDEVIIYRPYYFDLHITSFATSGITLQLRNISDGVLMNKYVHPGEVQGKFHKTYVKTYFLLRGLNKKYVLT